MKHTILFTFSLLLFTSLPASPLKLGVAGYSFHKRSLDDALAIMQKAGVENLCVKDFHLSYTSSDDEIAAFKEKCAKYGVTPYALGPLYTRDAAATRAYFEFAKRFGAKMVVGVPYEPGDAQDTWAKRKGSRKLLEEIDRLVKEFDIRYAIHNHGPASPEMYPDVAYGWNLVKDLDPRIGFCLDVGWEYGCGKDPAQTIREHAARIFDVHIKDFERGKPDGAAIPLGRGKLDMPSILRALADANYAGVCAIEYETSFSDNLAPIAECAGYFRGATACLGAPAKAQMMPAPKNANTLTEDEKAAGWQLLWDGKTSAGWVSAKNVAAFPDHGWVMADGTLTMRPTSGISPDGQWFPLPPEDQKLGGGGDIVTVKKYANFELSFDFRLTRAANSGVKYFIDETQNGGTAEEYQILENGHPDAEKGVGGNRKVASLYDIYPANADKIVKPIGQWNTGRIVVKGPHVEHWLNGQKVVEYERGYSAFRAAVAKSKYAKWGKSVDGRPQDWGEIPEGRILLQDHGDSTVSFCNLKIREIVYKTPPLNTNRDEVLAFFAENVYGARPDLSGFKKTCSVQNCETSAVPDALRRDVTLNVMTPIGERTFTAVMFVPARHAKPKVPCFVDLHFWNPNLEFAPPKKPSKNGNRERWPVDEFIKRGFAVVSFDYRDVFPDNSAEADQFGNDPKRPANGWGAISAWALGASRVMDYLETANDIDATKVAVAGHSRLGKTALWAGATDPRFAYTIINNSGCMGARASTRNIRGETIDNITHMFPHWFAPKFRKQFVKRDAELPFDQHWLVAAVAPRLVAIGSAEEDHWACPPGEKASFDLARPAWGDHQDRCHYHMRPGVHSFKRVDWVEYLNFAQKHGW